jgi:rRNA biogenesis protein RRP5
VKDREINDIEDVKVGQKLRGFVKNISSGGVYVALGRSVTARVMIKELFDDVSTFVWIIQEHFTDVSTRSS